ncbi:cation transporter [Enterococcus massiliensis]|uniref:cation transporter n=1 Tax=Enterococcus massiliensis TaxID=1640685 RepID=UPI00065DC376|nr:cation transporter [Enterococcus massiliensis]
MSEKQNIKKFLLQSIVAGSLYGSFALAFGLLAQANVLLLDGSYTLIGVAMSLITLYVAKYIEKQDFDKFPFGKESLMPLIIFVQYSIVLVISLYGVMGAVNTLLHPPLTANLSVGLFFSLFGTLYCFAFWSRFKNQKNSHPFFKLEMEQWRFAFFFSLGVFSSFLLSELFSLVGLSAIGRYIDPIFALLITIAFILKAIQELKKAILELTSATPKKVLREKLHQLIDSRLQKEDIDSYLLRTAKVGNQLIVELDVIIQPDSFLDTVTQQDHLRKNLLQLVETAAADWKLWLNVNFTADVRWAIGEEKAN